MDRIITAGMVILTISSVIPFVVVVLG